LDTGEKVLAILEGFPSYVIIRGAEHPAIASVNEMKIVVDVLPECQILRPVLKKNYLNPRDSLFFFVQGENYCEL
jgi:hypothetical protein